ncbi:MAG: heavy metal translocating P-type ATPase, partial [Betaproteobacteria bacterium]
IGHWLEARSVLGASRALEELVKVMPATAHQIKNGSVTDVDVLNLAVGDLVLVRPGEKIPSDGIVVEGESSLDEALLTGESKPVSKKNNDKVIGGAINGEGALKIQIEKTGEQTYLSQVVKLVKQAQESKSKTQDLANRAAALLFYVAIILGAATFGVWAALGNVQFAITRSVTVLVIACPHALGLAIPLIVALSTAITAKRGILIRDRKAFEEAKDINAVVFDKTGTLTIGQVGVTDVLPYVSVEELLGVSAGVEQNSEHPIAKAIVKYAKAQGITIQASRDFQAIPGQGAKAEINSKQVYVGGPHLLKNQKISVTDLKLTDLQNSGKTVVYTIVDGKLVGAFALADQVRSESKQAIQELKAKGISVFMLTGDSKAVAKNVAEELSVDGYFAEVLPDQKARQIETLRNQGFKVAMVGDGINDAPALVTADVGVAIGAGTDVAVESADIILVKNNPKDVVVAIDFSKRTYKKMVQNLWWATGYNVLALPLAAGVFAGLGIIVDPAVGAILMSLSTVLVAINSQTLRRQKTG